MSLRSQRRLAADLLKVGVSRVWIDPDRLEDVDAAITRDEIRRLIGEGVIRASAEIGVSRARARLTHEKRKKGRGRGAGSRKGKSTATTPRKKTWMIKVRAMRSAIRDLRDHRIITKQVYRVLYRMVKGGAFEGVGDLKEYVESRSLRRRR